jgi:hypothetical protein
MFRRRTCVIFRELKVPDKICLRYVMGAETCRSGINILNILFTSHMHVAGFNSF